MRPVLPVVVLCAVLNACAEQAPPPPKLLAISPNALYQTESVNAELTGSNFFNQVTSQVDDPSPPKVNDVWRVYVSTDELAQVARTTTTSLNVVLPQGLPLGVHDVTVVSPRGHTAILVNGLTVLDQLPPPPPPPTCTVGDVLLVTTDDANENDAGESPVPPHFGTGLSIWEAILLANTIDGIQCIQFAAPMTLYPTQTLPTLAGNDGSGAYLFGAGLVTIDGSNLGGGSRRGLAVDSNNRVGGMIIQTVINASSHIGIVVLGSNNVIDNNEVLDIDGIAIEVAGDGNVVGPGNSIHDASGGVEVTGTDNQITGNAVYSIAGVGVRANTTTDTSVTSNVIYQNGSSCIRLTGPAVDTIVRHNTTHQCSEGIRSNAIGITGTILENNLFSAHGDVGVDLGDPEIAVLDYNGYFGNISGLCGTCTVGNNRTEADPAFVDPSTGDFTLQAGSLVIDEGVDTGMDVNAPGLADGLFNGLAPDLGALESP